MQFSLRRQPGQSCKIYATFWGRSYHTLKRDMFNIRRQYGKTTLDLYARLILKSSHKMSWLIVELEKERLLKDFEGHTLDVKLQGPVPNQGCPNLFSCPSSESHI